MKNVKKILDLVAKGLLVLGGLNWGLVGVFNFDLVRWLLGLAGLSMYANVAFGLVGASAIWFAWNMFKYKGKY